VAVAAEEGSVEAVVEEVVDSVAVAADFAEAVIVVAVVDSAEAVIEAMAACVHPEA